MSSGLVQLIPFCLLLFLTQGLAALPWLIVLSKQPVRERQGLLLKVVGGVTLCGIVFFLLGVLLLGLGIMGEYIGRIFEQVRSRPRFVVAEVIGESPSAPATTSSGVRIAS